MTTLPTTKHPLLYDSQIEVTQGQYKILTSTDQFKGIFAHREENGKFFIKIWLMKYAKCILKHIS